MAETQLFNDSSTINIISSSLSSQIFRDTFGHQAVVWPCLNSSTSPANQLSKKEEQSSEDGSFCKHCLTHIQWLRDEKNNKRPLTTFYSLVSSHFIHVFKNKNKNHATLLTVRKHHFHEAPQAFLDTPRPPLSYRHT